MIEITKSVKKENGKISANHSLVIASCSTDLLLHIGLWHNEQPMALVNQ